MSEAVSYPSAFRPIPANLQAEQGVLGAFMMNSGRALAAVGSFLKPHHFADEAHSRLYAAILKAMDAGQPVDAVSLKGIAESDDVIRKAGGVGYVVQLLAGCPGWIMAAPYGRAVCDAWTRRTLLEAANALAAQATDGSSDLASVVSQATAMIEEAGNAAVTAESRMVTLGQAVEQALDEADRVARDGLSLGISTGMISVDRVLGGLEPSSLNILAGRPGSGKSTLGHQWAIAAAKAGVGVLELSLEMSSAALARRALAAAAGVPLAAIRNGQHAEFVPELLKARKELADLPLLIEDSAGMTPARIEAACRRAQQRFPIGLVLIDHLHLVVSEGGERSATEAVTAISRGMKRLAKKLNAPVLALAQLNRGLESRDDKRPGRADLRQSGAIEEDADTISFIHRPELYISKGPPDQNPGENEEKYTKRVADWRDHKEKIKGVADLIIDKVREGEPDVVRLRFRGETSMFEEP